MSNTQSKKNKELKEISEKEKKLASEVYRKFRDAMVAKSSYTDRWMKYLNAWDGSLFEKKYVPSYKTNHVSNFIYSTIESMRPVLFDNFPKFEAIPMTKEAMPYCTDINDILDWEWHRTNMQEICLANSIYTFALGTSVIMLTYEYDKKPNGKTDGDVKPIPVSPFNLYPDPLATCVEDAEYIIFADYKHVNQLKKQFPKHADYLQGGDINYSELVNDRDDNARLDNQVLVLEMWCRDYSTINDDDGNKRMKYPKGRVITVAPELNLVLEDKENPYNTGRFPFFLFKDIDVPFQFWGEGEVKWLLSPQNQVNDLYNQIIDNAKHTANMQWVIDKNSGIPKGELTNRPGLIIRKNPGSEVRRDSPPSMPMYVSEMVERLKNDVEVISGVHDVTRGQTPSGIQSASAIIALQEAAQIRIRLKITLHHNALGLLGTEWFERVKQFWKFNRVIPKKVEESKKLPQMQLNGAEMQPVNPMDQMMMNGQPVGMNSPTPPGSGYKMIDINPDEQLKQDYIIKIIGSNSPNQSRASMLDQLTRLAQTPAEDGMPMVPREAVLDYIPNVNKELIMQYFQKLKEERMAQQEQQGVNNQAMMQIQQLGQQIQEIGQIVQQLSQRADQEDQRAHEDDIRGQGYEEGINEYKLMQNQMEKNADLPPEIWQQIADMDDEALEMLMANHPEVVDQIMRGDGQL